MQGASWAARGSTTMKFRVGLKVFVYSILCVTAGGLILGCSTAANKVTRGADAVGSTAARAPGTKFRECRDCPDMIVIPSGSFTMGSPQYKNEKPQHNVAFSQVFAVGVFHVTRVVFAVFVCGLGWLVFVCFVCVGFLVVLVAVF